MDSKTLNVLEYPKILERLAGFCDFSASVSLARALEPTDPYDLAVSWLAETTEARKLRHPSIAITIRNQHKAAERSLIDVSPSTI